MDIKVQKSNNTVVDAPGVKGVEYLSDEEAAKYLREVGYQSVSNAEGEVIAKSVHAITPEEQKIIDSQVVRVGSNAGMTVLQVKEAAAKAAQDEADAAELAKEEAE